MMAPFQTGADPVSFDCMGSKRSHDRWLEDFSLVLPRRAMRSNRRSPKYDVFAGSKPLSIVWLAVISASAGAFGGTLVSGALWRSLLLHLPLWLAAIIGFCIVIRRSTLACRVPFSPPSPPGASAGEC